MERDALSKNSRSMKETIERGRKWIAGEILMTAWTAFTTMIMGIDIKDQLLTRCQMDKEFFFIDSEISIEDHLRKE